MVSKIIHAVLVLVVRLLFRVSVTGVERVPGSGPLLVMINHIAFLDPVLVTAVFPRRTVSLAKVEVLSLPVWGPLVKLYGTVPIRRGEGDLAAIRTAIEAVSSGQALLIAPEGTRSPDYGLQPGKAGLVTIATRTGAAVLPVAITGAHRTKQNWLRFRRAPIDIRVGQPFTFKPQARRQRQAAIDEAMLRLATLLPVAYRGAYQDLSSAGSAYTLALGADAT